MPTSPLLALALVMCWSLAASAQAPALVDQTAKWIPPGIQGDFDEKDFAFGDVDLDGDLDLVVARKLPFYSDSMPGTPGRKDFLLLNDGGAFVDATDTSLWPALETKARDVWVGDLTADGFPDALIVTTANSPLRLYVNQGNDATTGAWLGFDDESWRLPTIGPPIFFCAVAGGDVDGDGGVDLFLGGYRDPSGSQASNNVLLMNQCRDGDPDAAACTGAGMMPSFSDETALRVRPDAYINSINDFNTQVDLVDMNEDGSLDLVRLFVPQTEIFLNDGAGFFPSGVQHHSLVDSDANYMYAIADLDRDSNRRPDFYIVDDGVDRFYLGNPVAPGSTPSFTGPNFVSTSQMGDFDGNLSLGDINFDGFPDAAVASADVEIAGCPDGMELMMSDGTPAFAEAAGAWTVPNFEQAFVDLDGDSCVELVIGGCGMSGPGYRVFRLDHCPACDVNEDGSVNVVDAMLALQTAAGLIPAPADPGALARFDVAPLREPDGRVSVADALVILRGAAGAGGVCAVAAAQ